VNPLENLDLQFLGTDLVRVESGLRDAVANRDQFLGEVASHLVEAGGKRIRPALTLCAGYLGSGSDRPASDDIVVGAVAVELVHLGSLYHDDVIDEAETRRGVPSVNARWSNIVAILGGDYLLARASALAARLGSDVAALLATTIGELCRGQVVELQHLFDVRRTEERYYSAIEGKTATLFGTACRIGGVVLGLPAPTLDALTDFGRQLGICFQIVDDVLDLTATEQALGKPTGQDLVEGVYTLPVIYALQESPELRSLLGRPLERDALGEVRRLATADGAVDAALDVARGHAQKADAALAAAPDLDPGVRGALHLLGKSLVARSS
jgi:heptaprenyl diphosphate synthase